MVEVDFWETDKINSELNIKKHERKTYSHEYIDYVISNSSFEDVLNYYNFEYTPQKNGEFVVKCPFHNDMKHPNLFINGNKNVFFCFACGEKGNIVDFINAYNKCSFQEAVDYLAKISGINNIEIEDIIDKQIDEIIREEKDKTYKIYGMNSDIFNISFSKICGNYLIKNHDDIEFIEKIYKDFDFYLENKDTDNLQKIYKNLSNVLKNRKLK
jgi:DNA primase